jgi:TadE-like protein
MKHSICKRTERGNAIVEFALVAPYWVVVLFGTIAVGMNLTRTTQVVQVSRDLAHMYAKGADFSSPSIMNLLTGAGSPPSTSLVQGMDLSSTGNTVIILSQVRHVYSTDFDCASSACGNAGSDVFVNRIVIGNASLTASSLGDPNSADLDAHGNTKNPTTNAADRTNQTALFAPSYTWPGNGAVAYVAEIYVSSPELSFLGYSGAGNYSRAIF